MENNETLTKEELSMLQNRMMSLLRFEIVGTAPDKTLFDTANDEDVKRLYTFSKYHDIAHLVGDAIFKNGFETGAEIKSLFDKQAITSLYRYQNIQNATDELRHNFKEAQIPFILLKGAVLRTLYPEPWMRTSCDIDVLVHEEDIKKASKIVECAGYGMSGRTAHDISFTADKNIHLELHYSLAEDGEIGKAEQLLDSVWNHSKNINGFSECVLDDEMFYYYHLAHMAKHLECDGGCGIRPFLDLYILNHLPEYNALKRNELLTSGGLDKFAAISNELVDYWMEGKQPSALALQLESLILAGGTYGNTETRAVVGNGKNKGKFSYIVSRIWMPYNQLVGKYPGLRGKRILQPFYEIRRWFRLFDKETFDRSADELKKSAALSEETQKQTTKMLKDLGLI